ncbi:MAG: DUF4934 domain-containing protein [Mediterranea sp.]|jgi:hypothetical protein|nr:DUF4934 domain-containing protein [Mediterranea sp.]
MKTKRTICKQACGIISVLFLLTACSAPSGENTGVVDVATALEHPTELKLSQLGNHVRYVPLETTDSSLIGHRARVSVLKRHILVTFPNNCLLFDKETGKFMGKVGRVGPDPTSYSSPEPCYDEANDWLYFKREPYKWVKYDTRGHYLGTFAFSKVGSAPACCLFDGPRIIAYHEGMEGPANSITFFDASGMATDSIPSSLGKGISIRDLLSVNIKKLGNMSFMLLIGKDVHQVTSQDRTLWMSNQNVRFMEHFSDTLYTLEKNRLEPYLVFDTGKWKSGEDARQVAPGTTDCMMIGSVLESGNGLFFQCALDIYNEEKIPVFNGIYDKKTGRTYMAPLEDGIADDLQGLMPFHPQSVNKHGEYASLIEAGEVTEWMDGHPEVGRLPQWEPLTKLVEDDNPVAVIVTP